MSNVEYDDYPEALKRHAIEKMTELLLDFKAISPEGIADMYRQILKFTYENGRFNTEREMNND